MANNTAKDFLDARTRPIWALFFLLISSLLLAWPAASLPAEGGRVAVLPFRVHAPVALDHLKFGLQEMLTLRLGARGMDTVPPEIVNRHAKKAGPATDVSDMAALGKAMGARWVLGGSVTKIGEKISLDLKAVDAEGRKPPLLIYQVAEGLDALPATADRIAKTLDYQLSGVPQVDSIRVKGNQRIEAAAIQAVIRSKPGDRVDDARLDKDLRSVYQMGFFRDVKIETEPGAKGQVVVFDVTEKPSIGKILFEGNEEVDEEDLKKELGIRLYSILDRNQIKQSINRLKEFYRQKAFYNVEIEDHVKPIPNNQVQVTYSITEHEKVYIRKIEFIGNTHFDDDDLADIMETSTKGWLSWITDSGLLDQKKLEFDAHKVTSFYHNHGFIKAKVGEPKVTRDPEKGLKITIEVVEGAQYGVRDVSIEGDLIRPPDMLLEGMKIRQEKVFNREAVRQDIMSLREIYADDGYAYSKIAPDVREDDEAHLVDIVFKVSKGEKVRFGRISIAGNTKTRDRVIRRELWAVEGQYFSGKALKRSSMNLNRLGFFEEVDIKTEKSRDEDRMDLEVRVKEKPTGSFSFGAGYSSQDKLLGMAKVDQNNFMGYGVRLSASVKIGGRSSEFDIRVTEPWLLGRPVSGGARAFKWKREYDDYTKDSLGGEATLGAPMRIIDSYTRGWTRYRYEDSLIEDVDDTAADIIKEMVGRSVTSSIAAGLMRNTTDQAWNPTTGSINNISAEYAGGFLGGDNYFNKYQARSAWFFPLFWDMVFMLQGRGGYIDQRPGGELPVYEKFFLGGINSVRGFEYAAISPRDPETGDKIGGEKMVCFNAEYRFPLLKSQGITGVLFFDAGNVWTVEQSYNTDDLRMGAGGEIRWYSPMGPLRVAWGFNLDPRGDEPSNQVDFTMGTTF